MARILVSLLVAFSYPLLASPGRNSAFSIWKLIDKDEDRATKYYDFRFRVITAIFVLGTFGLAMVLTNLGIVLAIIGATGSTIITFILPGAAYYVMFEEEGPTFTRYCAAVLSIFGVLFMFTALICIFI